jgi:hypothetical protein
MNKKDMLKKFIEQKLIISFRQVYNLRTELTDKQNELLNSITDELYEVFKNKVTAEDLRKILINDEEKSPVSSVKCE